MMQRTSLPAADLSVYEIRPRLLIGELGGASVDTARPMIDLVEDHPAGACAMCNGTLPSPEAARWPRPRPGHEIDDWF